ncbi:hypothetical protein BpHYR1_025381 [Brachionus plicatilis]|uniref:Uncharacterized protein n=1 Tax=Brachionus plicatilis TaxID=10195 RepID=A0A3M7PLP1_BRAPC|nr:hypothetical protein BpHYR1_025381 [Brachionus plicatilis]
MSKSLLDQQAERSLSELVEIIEQKWVLSTNIGSSHVKSVYENYSKLTNEEEDQEVVVDSDKFANLSKCNQFADKLKSELNNLFNYMSRLEQIVKNLGNLFEMELDFFSNIDKNEFKKELFELKTNYLNEYQLKNFLVNEFLFKSRLKEECQTTLISLWINQPYIDEYLNFKIVSFIKFNLLKK